MWLEGNGSYLDVNTSSAYHLSELGEVTQSLNIMGKMRHGYMSSTIQHREPAVIRQCLWKPMEQNAGMCQYRALGLQMVA